ncbi:bifunctional 2-C-methyl-D-erythritol 4-phosphate cytidylyltransferase/2-C-methyl-D-erythritol 2,4-cyclodiphosphate synthase [Helicobacter sp. 11S03491-1]|nr:bifunctional 2-C-methyl-D-erythritol 4-phosphate cytidylyltransferase/2-C-methyl-D-erythritol 2,4-cyclodiphosphate synthase [Helicobacter sp. 11S03491-1]
MAAGSSSRFCAQAPAHYRIKKQWIRLGSLPLWQKVANDFKKIYNFKKIIITACDLDFVYMQKICDFEIVLGGKTRWESMQNALEHVQTQAVLISDVARWNLDENVFFNLLEAFDDSTDCVAPYLEVPDTAIYKETYIDRTALKLIQTPQLSRTQKLRCLKNENFTDESSAISANHGKVVYIPGSPKLAKLTYYNDIFALKELPSPSVEIFTGNGFDVHAFEKGKKMVLGGIEIQSDFGFAAHSDGDVALHALSDAILGAIGGGDIGEWFSDEDPQYKLADSKVLLKQIYDFAISIGFQLIHADITIIAQTPKIAPYKSKIHTSIAEILYMDKSRVNIKATTTENLGFIGRKEGIAVMANVNMKFINWKEKI